MTLLSNIIKSVNSESNKRAIEHKVVKSPPRQKLNIPTELKRAAEQIIEEAEKEASFIREQLKEEQTAFTEEMEKQRQQAEDEKNHVLEAARHDGFGQGYEEGKQEALAAFQGKMDQVYQILESAEQDYHNYLEQAEKEILGLALSISYKIIESELEENPEKWVTVVKNAIREVRDQDPIKVIVHPNKYHDVLPHRDELEAVTHHQRLMIVPDDQLKENDCIVETPFGRIEAGIDNQLKMLKTKLFEMLEDPNGKGQLTHR